MRSDGSVIVVVVVSKRSTCHVQVGWNFPPKFHARLASSSTSTLIVCSWLLEIASLTLETREGYCAMASAWARVEDSSYAGAGKGVVSTNLKFPSSRIGDIYFQQNSGVSTPGSVTPVPGSPQVAPGHHRP